MVYDVAEITQEIEDLYMSSSLGTTPSLAVILSESPLPGEVSYLKQMRRLADRYGVNVDEVCVRNPIEVTEYLCRSTPNGMIRVSDFGSDTNKAVDRLICYGYDIDGMGVASKAMWFEDANTLRVFPCTSLAAYLVLDRYFDGNLAGKDIAVINRSNTVGRPLSLLLGSRHVDANVHMFHSKSGLTGNTLRDMDAVVTATGKPQWFTFDQMRGTAMYKPLVVDVGVAEKDGKMVGDVDPRVEGSDYIYVAKSLGQNGIGRLTTTILFAKLFGGFGCGTLR